MLVSFRQHSIYFRKRKFYLLLDLYNISKCFEFWVKIALVLKKNIVFNPFYKGMFNVVHFHFCIFVLKP